MKKSHWSIGPSVCIKRKLIYCNLVRIMVKLLKFKMINKGRRFSSTQYIYALFLVITSKIIIITIIIMLMLTTDQQRYCM